MRLKPHIQRVVKGWKLDRFAGSIEIGEMYATILYYKIRGNIMTATVRLDDNLESTLLRLSNLLHKKKSDVIREAISFYAQNIEQNKKSRLLNAVEKTKDIDRKEFKDFDGVLSDGI